MHAPTGQQFEISANFEGVLSRAIITEVAAGLRVLEVGGTPLIESFPETIAAPSASGIVLAPWPNRVDHGKWQLDGVTQQLELTEVVNDNAIHGLLRFTAYRVVEHDGGSITLTATAHPQHGYPFFIETVVTYRLVPEGLRVTHTLTNHSATKAPVALGTHPYFRIGDVPTAELTVQSTATTVFDVNERMIPVGEHPIAGGPLASLSTGALVGELRLDHGFGGASVAGSGARTSLTAPDGAKLTVWADEDFDYVQIYTLEGYPSERGPVFTIAIEPMTAPANGLATGQGIRWLEPEESWTLSWGIEYSGSIEGE